MKLVPIALLLLGLAAPLSAQTTGDDPRDVSDPSESSDPRGGADPREDVEGAAPKVEQLTGTELLDALWENGASPALTDALRDQAWSLLGYIDSNCEGWLALVESGAMETEEGRAKAEALVEKGKSLARLTDAALRDSRFTQYVDTFTSWDAEQQKRFREGQAKYGEARRMLSSATTPGETLRALTPLQQSLDLARPLGDTWGQSMALTLMGKIHMANESWEDARRTMRQAIEAGRSIRDLDSVWGGLNAIFEASMALDDLDDANESLQDQYQLSIEMGDEESAQRVVERMLELDVINRDRQEGRR